MAFQRLLGTVGVSDRIAVQDGTAHIIGVGARIDSVEQTQIATKMSFVIRGDLVVPRDEVCYRQGTGPHTHSTNTNRPPTPNQFPASPREMRDLRVKK